MLETTAIIVLVLGITIFFLLRKKRPVLSDSEKARVQKLWDDTLKMTDPAAQVLEAEKVVHYTWKKLGEEGSFGEILKRIGKTLPHEQRMWNAHKLRNCIAHEPGMKITAKEAEKALAAFEKALSMYL